jgi:hypothetical protein
MHLCVYDSEGGLFFAINCSPVPPFMREHERSPPPYPSGPLPQCLHSLDGAVKTPQEKVLQTRQHLYIYIYIYISIYMYIYAYAHDVITNMYVYTASHVHMYTHMHIRRQTQTNERMGMSTHTLWLYSTAEELSSLGNSRGRFVTTMLCGDRHRGPYHGRACQGTCYMHIQKPNLHVHARIPLAIVFLVESYV